MSHRLPRLFTCVAAAALLIQLHPDWRGAFVYDRGAIAGGQLWRLWTGHLVHFGWAHFVTDGGLFVILGFLIEPRFPRLCGPALAILPAIIAASLFLFDPGMERYGGLSAVNLGLLIFLACNGLQRNLFDWFWPAVIAVYIAEIVFEATYGQGRGGGMIRFDDQSVHVATAAHLPGAVLGVLLWAFSRSDAARPVRIQPSN
jgi:rhomboid family GlyGly-CTERM serine protease